MQFSLSQQILTISGSLLMAISLFANEYKLNVVYKTSGQLSSIAHSGHQHSQAGRQRSEILTITPSAKLEKEIEQYVKQNIYVASAKFKEIYGVTPEAFRLSRIIAKNDPNIKYALPVGVRFQTVNANVIANDSDELTGTNVTQWFRQAWDMGPGTSTTYGIDAPGAWTFIANRNLDTHYVAVIDTGVAPNAAYDFRSRLDYSNSYNFTDDFGQEPVQMNKDIEDNNSYHGTHVGGTIIANGPNVTGVAGPISSVQAYALRALDNGASITATDVAKLWAVNQLKNPEVLAILPYLANFVENPHPAKVLNQSYGLSRIFDGQPIMSLDAWVDDVFIPFCLAAEFKNELINATGAVQVMAAGNDGGTDGQALINSIEAGCPNIKAVVVEATNAAGDLSYYSTRYDEEARLLYESYADILQEELGAVQPQSIIVKAPGGSFFQPISGINGNSGEVYSTVNCPTNAGSNFPTPDENLDCYEYFQGTSMATPHASGIIALIYALKPDAGYDYVASILSQSTDTKGVLNARKVVENVVASQNENRNDTSGFDSIGQFLLEIISLGMAKN